MAYLYMHPDGQIGSHQRWMKRRFYDYLLGAATDSIKCPVRLFSDQEKVVRQVGNCREFGLLFYFTCR